MKSSAKRISLAASAVLSVVLLGASGEESPAAQQGHNLYEQYCQDCHGMKGRGDGPLAGDLKAPPADLATIAARRKGVFPDVEIREIIDGRRVMRAHGPQHMPLWGKAFGISGGPAGPVYEAQTRDKIEAVIVYLKTLQK